MASLSAYRNVIGTCISFITCYGSFIGMVNLQSSINAQQGLGLATLAILFGIGILTAVIVPPLLHSIGAKYVLCIGYSLRLIYILANYYPSWYILIPGSILGGIGDFIMWVSIEVHMSLSARKHAASLSKSPNNLIGLYMGALIFSMKLGQIYGGLTSSVILFTVNAPALLNNTNNDTTLSIELEESFNINDTTPYCTNKEALYAEQNYLYYILVSVYVVVTVIGILVALVSLDNHATDAKFVTLKKFCDEYFIGSLKNVVKVALMWKMALLFLLFVLAATTAYFLGSFSNVYISECVGVRWVGFSLTVFGIFSGITSLLIGRLYKYLPTILLVCTSTGICAIMSLFLIFWERMANFGVIFALSLGWGWVDGSWHTIGETLTGVHFPGQQEAAFTIYGIGISLGYVISFILPIYFDTRIEMSVYIGLVITVTIMVSTLLVLVKRNKKLPKQMKSCGSTKDCPVEQSEKDFVNMKCTAV